MKHNILQKAIEYGHLVRQKKRWHRVLTCMAAVVVFITTYALILPAITMERETICGLNEQDGHIHTDECYLQENIIEETASRENMILKCLPEDIVHVHTAECLDESGQNICGYADFVIHTHNNDCYKDGELVCLLTEIGEHLHGEDCYLVVQEDDIAGISTETESAETEVAETESAETEVAETESAETEVAETESAETEGAETESAETERTEAEGVKTESAETESVETESVETESVETESIEAIIEEVHTHTAECYITERGEQICTLAAGDGHVHGEECYTAGDLYICELEERPGHTHAESCYEEAQALVCEIEATEGHAHGEACHEETQTLICEVAESEEHAHGEGCYEKAQTLICELEEAESHVHGEECYEKSQKLICELDECEGHSHSEECLNSVLVCELTEAEVHQHEDSCFAQKQTLICELEESIAVIDGEAEERTEATTETEVEESTEATTETEVEESAEESTETTTETEESTETTTETEVVEESTETTTETEVMEESAEVTTETEAVEETTELEIEGELLCTLEEIQLHQHEDSCFDENGRWICGYLEVIEHVHDDNCFQYLTQTFTYSDDKIEATVEVVTETGIPADTQMIFSVLDYASEDYAVYADYAVENVDGELTALAAYEISLLSGEQELELPDAQITVNVSVKEIAEPEMQLMTLELEDEETEAAEGTEEDIVQLTALQQQEDGISSGETLTVDGQDSVELTLSLGSSRSFALARNTIELPTFTVQYYAHMQRFATADEATDGGHELPVINTDNPNDSGGYLPENKAGTESPTQSDIFYLQLEPYTNGDISNAYKIQMVEYLGKVYEDHQQKYNGAMTIKNLDILRDNEHYLLDHIVTQNTEQRTQQLTSLGEAQPVAGSDLEYDQKYWMKYQFATTNVGDNEFFFTIDPALQAKVAEDGTITYFVMLEDGTVKEKTSTEKYMIKNEDGEEKVAIYVSEDMTVRFGYESSEGMRAADTTFFDYDISRTTGYYEGNFVYNTVFDKFSGGYATVKSFKEAATEENDVMYMLTYDSNYGGAQGINYATNYSGSGVKYAFGNANTGTRLGDLSVTTNKGTNAVTLNKESGVDTNPDTGESTYNTSFYGCSFGLVEDYDPNENTLEFFSGVDAPKGLFNSSVSTTGKTSYPGNWLDFYRHGDTYTLTGVNSVREDGKDDGQIEANNLDVFIERASTWIKNYTVTSNDFWPMDGLIDDETVGHDFKFGSYNDYVNRKKGYANVTSDEGFKAIGNLPQSDGAEGDNGDRNSYFGMNFAVEFTLDGKYTGPLEYLFYGDDDMWVFLTEINDDGTYGTTDLVCDIGGVHGSVGSYTDLWDWIEHGEAGKGTYRLTFFYTERGATGSSCYMQFTIPDAIGVPLDTDSYGALKISKDTNVSSEEEYEFNIELINNKITAPYTIYQNNGDGTISTVGNGVIREGAGKFKLKDNQYALIEYIHISTQYKVWETSNRNYDVQWQSSDTTVQTTVDANGNTCVTGTITSVSEVALYCTNTLYNDLTISKVLDGFQSDTKFEFNVKLENVVTDADGNQTRTPVIGTFAAVDKDGNTLEDVLFMNSGATMGLAADESITIKKLPVGVTWTITEVNTDGFNVSYKVDAVNVGSTNIAEETGSSDTATGTVYNASNQVTFINKTSYMLPATGGTGTNLYTIGGLVLMFSAVCLMYKNLMRRKEDCEK